jgi:hypothetical protein
VQVIGFTPSGQVGPGGAQLEPTPGQLSAAIAVGVAVPVQTPGSVGTTRSGAVTDGGSSSFTVTVVDPEAMLPEVSVAVQVTVVTPNGKVDPEAGAQTTPCSPQLSPALGGG